MIAKLTISEFLEFKKKGVIFDVRSPGEYAQAHIPGALSLPLFNDEERAIIGTAYKQQSREKAIKIGLSSFGRNLVKMVEEVEKMLGAKHAGTREIGVHCWRGGMRSAAVAWLLDLYGFKVFLLTGGYKAYRQWAVRQFEKPYHFYVVGGYTGSNKTGVLERLRILGEAVINLEELAGHKGSAFGNLNREKQISQEMFENTLAEGLAHYPSQPIWIEDESQRIGAINLPNSLFKTLHAQHLLFMDVPFNERLDCLFANYGKYDKEKLINAILRIKKRLGGLETKNAVNFILEDDLKSCFAVLLKYYDKFYLNGFLAREDPDNQTILPFATTSADINAETILHYVQNNTLLRRPH